MALNGCATPPSLSPRNKRIPTLTPFHRDTAPLMMMSPSPVVRIDPLTTRVGWIGTGVMGRWMCEHLIKRGGFRHVLVHNRTAAKAEPLLKLGARLAESPRAVAAGSDVVFTIVGYPRDVRQVILGDDSENDGGVLGALQPGSILVDMTTSQPSLAQVGLNSNLLHIYIH